MKSLSSRGIAVSADAVAATLLLVAFALCLLLRGGGNLTDQIAGLADTFDYLIEHFADLIGDIHAVYTLFARNS